MEPTDVKTLQERESEKIRARTSKRTEITAALPGNFRIEEQVAAKAMADKAAETSPASDVAFAAKVGVGEAAQRLGTDLAIRADSAALNARQESDDGFLSTSAAILQGAIDKFAPYDDATYNPGSNDRQFTELKTLISELGVEDDSPEALDLASARSVYERDFIAEQIRTEHTNMQRVAEGGNLSKAAFMAAGFADIDMVVAGGVFSKLSKISATKRLAKADKLKTLTDVESKALIASRSRTGNIIAGAEAGASSAIIVEGTNIALDPTRDSRDIIGALAVSTALGTGIGALLPTSSAQRVADNIMEVRTMESARQAAKSSKELPEFDPDLSVGAARIPRDDTIDISEGSESLIDHANAFFDENSDLDMAFTTMDEFVDSSRGAVAQGVQSIAQKAYEGLNKTPFMSDYDRLMGTTVGKYIAYHTVDSPIGQVVNNRAGTATADLLEFRASREYAPKRALHYSNWANEQGIKRVSKDFHWKGQHQFGKEVYKYMAQIHAGHKPKGISQHIINAADDLDRSFSMSLDANKKHGVDGFEDVEHIKGHAPHNWMGQKFHKVEAEVGTARVVDALKKGIMRMSDLDEELAFVYASAIKRGAVDAGTGSPTGQLHTVPNSGIVSLTKAIEDMNLHEATGKTPSEMADAILFKDSERGTVKSSRRRIAIDMTTPIEGSDFSLLDLVDTDIYRQADRLTRSQSQHAGLASVGLQQRDRDRWVQAARDDARSTGGNSSDIEKAGKAVDNVFSMFDEGAFGSVSATAGRINTLSRLSFLAQLGVTQVAEAGVSMGVVGINSWQKHARMSLKDMVSGKDSEIMDSLYGANKFVPQHNQFTTTDRLDDVDLDQADGFMKIVDTAMDKGMRGMGYLSGFYKVNEFLHRISAVAMNDYMIKQIMKGTNGNIKRLESMGVDDNFANTIRSKVADGTITFTEDGYVKSMGTEKWSPSNFDTLEVITQRNMDQTVQKARRGESHAWQYTELGSLFSNLKSFVFTAAQKQMIRNARLADGESFQMMTATLGTSALAYTAKQVINGKGEDLSTEKIVKGALQWSPLVSPALMAVDPLAWMVGADKIPGSPLPLSDWRYAHGGMISAAGISAANQLVGALRVPADLAEDGKLDRNSLNAIRAVPVIGRIYGGEHMLNLLKE
jgi:hypothetical protein